MSAISAGILSSPEERNSNLLIVVRSDQSYLKYVVPIIVIVILFGTGIGYYVYYKLKRSEVSHEVGQAGVVLQAEAPVNRNRELPPSYNEVIEIK